MYDLDFPKNQDAASVYFDEESQKIYIPTFSSDTEIYVFDVKYDSNGKLEYVFDKIYGLGENMEGISNINLPYAVQGVATYNAANGEKYILMTSSYSGADSIITKYKINEDDSLTFTGQKIFDTPGLENIVIDENGAIYGNVENYVGGRKDQDGGTFIITNVSDINDSSDDNKYCELMNSYKIIAENYNK